MALGWQGEPCFETDDLVKEKLGGTIVERLLPLIVSFFSKMYVSPPSSQR